ncbi:HD-GYP domain-containing protein [Clostridium sp. E02]|uniref:sensor domain-containing diguanylate cyclase/phosphohydrolase n=1 Tax=Clostridium sp. E02 TaxID=2487134 RepID=UPI001FAAE182|nr:HD-GYP domain-containing protein [Clostridium sp. E02]
MLRENTYVFGNVKKKNILNGLTYCLIPFLFGIASLCVWNGLTKSNDFAPHLRIQINKWLGSLSIISIFFVLCYFLNAHRKKNETIEGRYRSIIQHMQVGIAVYEGRDKDSLEDYRLIEGNQRYVKMGGFKEKVMLNQTFSEIHKKVEPEFVDQLKEPLGTGKPVKFEWFLKETKRYYEVTGFCSKPHQLVFILNDITSQKLTKDRLNYLNYHDPLTGLYNRKYFEKMLIQLDQKSYYPLGITIADINGLKLINDSFGVAAGDQLIQSAAQVLIEGRGETDVVCRLGGDEFVLLSPNTLEHEVREKINVLSESAKKRSINQVALSLSFGYSLKNSKEDPMIKSLKNAEDFMHRRKLLESPSMRGKAIYTIMTTLHEKNPREEEHSLRVSNLCEKMGTALGFPEDEIKELKTVGLLHDIGKVAIEEGILNKNGKLDKNEWIEIKKHPEIGYRILSTVNDLSEMADYVLAHHEHWDGSGYPKGLKGTQIPVQSRIIAIADAYDAMISERSYRHALPKEQAVCELERGAGTQFCKEWVKIFIDKVINEVS